MIVHAQVRSLLSRPRVLYARKVFKHLHPAEDRERSESRLRNFHFDSAPSGADMSSAFK